jgi:hypothetical protein
MLLGCRSETKQNQIKKRKGKGSGFNSFFFFKKREGLKKIGHKSTKTRGKKEMSREEENVRQKKKGRKKKEKKFLP